MTVFNRLTGEGLGTTPPELNRKFAADGSALRFAGTTFVCHTEQPSPLHNLLVELQETLQQLPGNECFSYLPASSFHVTLFRGVHMDNPKQGYWPEDFPRDLSQSEASSRMLERLQDLVPPVPISFKPQELTATLSGHVLYLEPASDEDAERLCQFRSYLENALKLFAPEAIASKMHISFDYMLKWLNADAARAQEAAMAELYAKFIAEQPILTFNRVEFCEYQDMTHFEPVRGWE
ncbi:DUF1868 domain-containing protein [Rhodobacteraceae bacterium RKSG542]|uniref:DUF1868 domain-containing protein n=1 Tax=Pseudovibrio flavus TaxID=2529854 RepID=UPI0012BCD131|nr:DUF1868 domain-containing protein [Pseudovibrio flavus]MTI18138.1 DUF1868 domain-containing protein [Pseudovibrio flavus]